MSEIEHELRILETPENEMIALLERLGAKKAGEYSFRRHVFEVIPAVKGRWVRLRSDGKVTTLTVKQIANDLVDGTSEWETKVDDFDLTLKLLEKMGFKSKGYQENRRVEYTLDQCSVCIDTWPKIPTYTEIEGPSPDAVHGTLAKLGFSKGDATGMNTEKIYLKYGIDISKQADLSF